MEKGNFTKKQKEKKQKVVALVGVVSFFTLMIGAIFWSVTFGILFALTLTIVGGIIHFYMDIEYGPGKDESSGWPDI